MEKLDVLIIGGGIAGLATAWHMAQRGGSRVMLLERELHLGVQSSGKNASILRTQSADPRLTAIARRSAAFLHDAPQGFASRPLIHPTGVYLLAQDERAPGLGRFVRENYAPGEVEELPPAELARRLPYVRSNATRGFLFQREGHIDCEALIEAFARGARRRGTQIETGCAVRELRRSGSRVAGVVLSDGRELAATTTVLAAGGWAGELGREAGSRLRLRPTKRHIQVTRPDERVPADGPVVWLLGPDEFYLRPEAGGWLLCACDTSDVDPDRCEENAKVRDLIAAKTARHLPEFAALEEADYWCGLRTMTDDGLFAVGPDPGVEGLFWVAGLGGAGMTSGAELGRIAAGLLSGEEPDELGRALDPARLTEPGQNPTPIHPGCAAVARATESRGRLRRRNPDE